jgi:predicted small lipoprotein YifL
MKKLTAIMLVIVLLLSMTGCGVAETARKLDAAEDKVEAKLDAAEDKVENALREAVPSAPASPGAKDAALTAEQAQQIEKNKTDISKLSATVNDKLDSSKLSEAINETSAGTSFPYRERA